MTQVNLINTGNGLSATCDEALAAELLARGGWRKAKAGKKSAPTPEVEAETETPSE